MNKSIQIENFGQVEVCLNGVANKTPSFIKLQSTEDSFSALRLTRVDVQLGYNVNDPEVEGKVTLKKWLTFSGTLNVDAGNIQTWFPSFVDLLQRTIPQSAFATRPDLK